MNKVYEHRNFIILKGSDQYILVNQHKGFNNGHTHLRNYKTALWLIKLAEHCSIPYHISLYLLESLIRISEDETYINQLKELQKLKQIKGNFQYKKHYKKNQ